MNLEENGKFIAKLRKEAGYTQKSLAAALMVSDKAVSKWERGVCMPDSSLMNKLSMLLDVDIEHIISGLKPYGEDKVYGEIRCKYLDNNIGGKPLIYYLLSYLMLIGIKDIYIKTDNPNYVRSLNLEHYGINVFFNPISYNHKTVIVYESFFLFGANITRYFHSFISSNVNIIPSLDGYDLPILFTDKPQFSIEWHKEKCERRKMNRGITYISLETEEGRNDASVFVTIYEKHHKLLIADLNEIAKNRNFPGIFIK